MSNSMQFITKQLHFHPPGENQFTIRNLDYQVPQWQDGTDFFITEKGNDTTNGEDVNVFAFAEYHGSQWMRFCDISDTLIECHHLFNHPDFIGATQHAHKEQLYKNLAHIYGFFDEKQIVQLVWFGIDKLNPYHTKKINNPYYTSQEHSK